jgi:hypothetical protein
MPALSRAVCWTKNSERLERYQSPAVDPSVTARSKPAAHG